MTPPSRAQCLSFHQLRVSVRHSLGAEPKASHHPQSRPRRCLPEPSLSSPAPAPRAVPSSLAALGSAIGSGSCHSRRGRPRGPRAPAGPAPAHPVPAPTRGGQAGPAPSPGSPRSMSPARCLASSARRRSPKPVPTPTARRGLLLDFAGHSRPVSAPGGVGRGGAFPGATQPPDRQPVRPAT